MADMEEEALLMLLLLRRRRRKQETHVKKKKRRIWVHEVVQRRKELGEFHHLVRELGGHDDRFFTYFRMSQEQFAEVLRLVKGAITKKTTRWREAISPAERLAVCLR